MIDFEHIGKYTENNRIEAKRSLGGLPKSIWETYSAFANTFGGILLLGVEELTDKSFRTVNLPNPEKLIEEFWEIINNQEKVSANILSKWDVGIHEIEGNRIISITVPRADRRQKPVYIGNNPYLGTYRRDGEGDYHCTEEEVRMMLRDSEERTLDQKVLQERYEEVFCEQTVDRYLSYLRDITQDERLKHGQAEEILCAIGATKGGEDGICHATAAGLLMFGYEDDIVREYPYYHLVYEEWGKDGNIAERIISGSGKWSGNLFDFYLKISGKIVRGLPYDIHRLVREAVANCMVNGDYMGSGGLHIAKKQDEIVITNPGSFRIDIQEAIDGGKSDPRNAGIAGMFNRVKVGTYKGKGVPDIYRVWKEKGWMAPRLQERLRPDRITLRLPFSMEKQEEARTKYLPGMQEYREKVMDYVTKVIKIDGKEINLLLGLNEEEGFMVLERMVADGILVRCDGEEQRVYQLKI